uniref:Uncharacterized protein n=1 Tax=Arundo donax TaxID=35708 RepID=A0A0A9A111_ARUDO
MLLNIPYVSNILFLFVKYLMITFVSIYIR